MIGSGVIWPDLDSSRIRALTPSVGFVPQKVDNERADIFQITINPRQTITYVAELVTDRATKEPVSEKQIGAVVAECAAQGAIIGATNRSVPGLNNVLCFAPALIAKPDDIDQITDIVDRALTKVFV